MTPTNVSRMMAADTPEGRPNPSMARRTGLKIRASIIAVMIGTIRPWAIVRTLSAIIQNMPTSAQL